MEGIKREFLRAGRARNLEQFPGVRDYNAGRALEERLPGVREENIENNIETPLQLNDIDSRTLLREHDYTVVRLPAQFMHWLSLHIGQFMGWLLFQIESNMAQSAIPVPMGSSVEPNFVDVFNRIVAFQDSLLAELPIGDILTLQRDKKRLTDPYQIVSNAQFRINMRLKKWFPNPIEFRNMQGRIHV
ncbi:hypothetical protein P280DRAFT_547273 [Massarina eburnea CBS 473.64]|uniref:Uncharacterized protein n=1 Tax=Massarina eburnea CBS 473.64 TaxID=1395130 RepID=A0A6A6S764_9PLEO|nr:hypothetical protein P280DRAFT_547273 [Massarina eburnea CBS 473.64]